MASSSVSLADTMESLYSMGYASYRPEPFDLNYTPVDSNMFNASKNWILGSSNISDTTTLDISNIDISSPTAGNVISAAQLKTTVSAAGDANKYYQKARKQQIAGAITNLGSAAYNIYTAQQGRKNVEFANAQLDVQKTMIDTNVAKTVSSLYNNMRDATSQLQTITAAKNVDIRSQGVESQIVAGGQDLGQDQADLIAGSKLQKAAINYQKAANKIQQAQAEQNAIANLATTAAGSIISFL